MRTLQESLALRCCSKLSFSNWSTGERQRNAGQNPFLQSLSASKGWIHFNSRFCYQIAKLHNSRSRPSAAGTECCRTSRIWVASRRSGAEIDIGGICHGWKIDHRRLYLMGVEFHWRACQIGELDHRGEEEGRENGKGEKRSLDAMRDDGWKGCADNMMTTIKIQIVVNCTKV